MERLDLTAPKSWAECTQEQLAFLLHTIGMVNRANEHRKFQNEEDFAAQTMAQVATLCLFSWNGVRVLTPYADRWLVAHEGRKLVLSTDQISAAASALAWVGSLPEVPVRLECIDGAKAVDADLDDSFSFDDWLSCEALWQGYQATKDEQYLQRMAGILYRKEDIRLKDFEMLSIFYWWAAVKEMCNRMYSHFFQPSTDGGSAPELNGDVLRRSMDSQIRALTKGDITKEEKVLAMPAHRALTELDALAREFEELNRKYPVK